MENVAAGMMVPLWLHWYSRGAVPEAEHVSVVVCLSCTVFEVSPESVMRTFDGTAVEGVGMHGTDYQFFCIHNNHRLDDDTNQHVELYIPIDKTPTTCCSILLCVEGFQLCLPSGRTVKLL